MHQAPLHQQIAENVMYSIAAVSDPSVIEWANLRAAHLQNKESDTGTKALSQELATSIEGVIAKLRSALFNSTSDPRVEGAVLCDAPLTSFDVVRREAIFEDDYENECLWTAITSLEAMIAPPTSVRAMAAEFDAIERDIRSATDNSDEALDARHDALYAIVERVQALPNTPENLAIRARAVCSAVESTGVVAEMTLHELSAHAEGNAGELVRDILACLLGQASA